MAAHEVRDERVGDLDGIVLVSYEHDLRVAFAPGAGMVGYSLTHRGEELLGQRGGLPAYREHGSTFGIPLLHPWANRLAGTSYAADGSEVRLDPRRSPIRLDENGLPIHGVLAAYPHWEIVGRTPGNGRAAVAARLDYGAHEELMAAFPYPHELHVQAELVGDTLTIATIVLPTAAVAVPVSFGWHPYLRLPDVPRSDWRVELPVRTRALLDERTYDDHFVDVDNPTVFALEGGGRRIELSLRQNYPFAQVYAPIGVEQEPYVCFEPMTAAVNALVVGDGLSFVAPGGSFRAEFTVRIRAVG